jgi:hypothetical protein
MLKKALARGPKSTPRSESGLCTPRTDSTTTTTTTESCPSVPTKMRRRMQPDSPLVSPQLKRAKLDREQILRAYVTSSIEYLRAHTKFTNSSYSTGITREGLLQHYLGYLPEGSCNAHYATTVKGFYTLGQVLLSTLQDEADSDRDIEEAATHAILHPKPNGAPARTRKDYIEMSFREILRWARVPLPAAVLAPAAGAPSHASAAPDAAGRHCSAASAYHVSGPSLGSRGQDQWIYGCWQARQSIE